MKLYRPLKWNRWVDWRVTQYFWENPDYYKKVTNWSRPYHLGIDYATMQAWKKTECYSCTAWLVKKIWNDPKWFWNFVVISVLDLEIFYAHLDAISVVEWQQVSAYQKLWIIWMTGNATWVHLHLWLKKWWQWINPTEYITDWEEKEQDEEDLLQCLIDEKIWNWKYSDWITKRILLLVAKSRYSVISW